MIFIIINRKRFNYLFPLMYLIILLSQIFLLSLLIKGHKSYVNEVYLETQIIFFHFLTSKLKFHFSFFLHQWRWIWLNLSICLKYIFSSYLLNVQISEMYFLFFKQWSLVNNFTRVFFFFFRKWQIFIYFFHIIYVLKCIRMIYSAKIVLFIPIIFMRLKCHILSCTCSSKNQKIIT